MKVLDKLRIPSDSEGEYLEDSEREYGSDFGGEPASEIAPDDPRRDPVPGEAPRKTRTPRAVRTEPPKITKKHRDDAAEEVQTFLEAIALAWGWQAPPCGEALEEAAPVIAEKMVKLLARNPKWLMKVRDGGILADAVGVAIALKPVATTAWQFYSQPAGGDSADAVFDPARFQPYDGSGGLQR